MSSFSSLLSDTKNFISNNITPVIITLLGLAIIAQLITFFFYPTLDSIEPLRQFLEQTIQKYGDQLSAETLSQSILALPESERQQLIPAAMSFVIQAGIVFLVINLLSMSTMIGVIYSLSYQQFSLGNILRSMSKAAPKILLFMLLAIPGFLILSLIVSVIPPLAAPLIMLAVVFYLAVYVVFLAVIIEPTQYYGFMRKFKITFRFLKRETRLIISIIGLWYLVTLLLNALSNLLIANVVIFVIFNMLELFVTFITLCYLYRLYSLSNKELPYDTRN